MQTITICEKEYPIKSNAFTRFQYKKFFGKGIFEDIKILNDFSEEQEKIKNELEKQGKTDEEIEKEINSYMMCKLDNFIDVVEKIAYILIYTASDKIGNFENWLKNIDKIDLSEKWITEVTEYAVNSFC